MNAKITPAVPGREAHAQVGCPDCGGTGRISADPPAAYVLGGLWLAWWLLIDLGRAEQ